MVSAVRLPHVVRQSLRVVVVGNVPRVCRLVETLMQDYTGN